MSFSNKKIFDSDAANNTNITFVPDHAVLTVPKADRLCILDALNLDSLIGGLLAWSTSTVKAMTGGSSAMEGACK